MSKGGSKKESVVSLPIITAGNERIIDICKTSLDDHSNNDTDLFNFLRQMHLTGGANGITVTCRDGVANGGHNLGPPPDHATTLLVSRKRKAWEGIHSGGNKWVGGQRPPALRSSDNDDEGHLVTPNCSNTGYEDECEDNNGENENRHSDNHDAWEEHDEHDTHVHQLPSRESHQLLSPIHHNLLNVEDIDADNLAADFDGSFTGLGVDINTANYSMSEAMMSLNNIALANHHLKQEGSTSRLISLKSEPQYLFSNYGALDLSNDEAQHPDNNEGTPSPSNGQPPPTFSGSVSRDNSQDAVNTVNLPKRASILKNTKEEQGSPQKEIQSDHHFVPPPSKHQSVILSHSKQDGEQYRIVNPKSENVHIVANTEDETDSRFQYILAAPTSIATKTGEPSLTYINQGQSYEIKIKKLGDISGHYKKKWLRSTIRICFHERRLQYIESEQIAEWSKTHPNERILEIDMPLSYGIADVKQDPSNLSTVSFLWDPTRDTGIFVKVHCISTEFTPKKHGGERGVPFRLQVETWTSEDIRLHAGACILQVFKLKGADRKHKQDREKVSKRPDSEKDKFCPQYECTMLTDLSVDSIYIPPSRGVSPVQSDSESIAPSRSASNIIVLPPPSASPISSRDVSPLKVTNHTSVVGGNISSPSINTVSYQPPCDSKTWKIVLPHTASAETAAGWLAYNRYGQHVKTFTDFDARDLLRLNKDDIVQMIGLVDGIRLYNDLHMKPVAPRLTLYLAQKGESLFHPVLLQDVTVAELVRNIAEILEVPVGLFHKVVVTGPNKISIKMTDEFLRYQSFDSAFHYLLIHEEGEACTIHLEPVTYS